MQKDTETLEISKEVLSGIISIKYCVLKLGISRRKLREEINSGNSLLIKSNAFKTKFSYESFKKEYERIHGFEYTEN